MPSVQEAYVAQSVERPAFNRVVAGSIPAMGMHLFFFFTITNPSVLTK